MLNDDQNDYHMQSRALIDFIDDNLKAKKFDFIQAKDVLEHFIDKGIFIEEHDGLIVYIRFRFSCFMHYFLMRKMDFDANFKAYVLKPDVFLIFSEEIELFTGTKRDSVDILQLIIRRMEDEFHDINDSISMLPKKYDEIFAAYESQAATYDESFSTCLSEAPKPTQSELDIIRDDALEKMPFEKGINKKDANISPRKRMELLWTLAAQVLKNTEETTITETELKNNAYMSILKCSITYAFLWKVFIERFIIEANERKTDFNPDEELNFQREALPLIHELWLRMLLGTTKLSVVIREKIESDEKNPSISDFERFISIFLYSDIRGRDGNKYIQTFIKDVHNPNIIDMVLFKLLGYYFLRSKTKDSDKEYENMIGDLIVNARGFKKREKSEMKGKIIQDYRHKRLYRSKSSVKNEN